MAILLDTHILFWSVFEPGKLNQNETNAISDTNNKVLVSVVSLWELAIKKSIGKIELPDSFFQEINNSGFNILGLSPAHIEESTRLPLLHRDPFDRMLVAQTKTENLSLITRDKGIQKYFSE